MSKVLAQLYDGNPMSISEEDLQELAARCDRFEGYRGAETTIVHKAGKGRDPQVDVVVPARRAGGPLVIASFNDVLKAQLFVDALRYMDLFVAAVRELRQRPELIAKNQLAHRADAQKGTV